MDISLNQTEISVSMLPKICDELKEIFAVLDLAISGVTKSTQRLLSWKLEKVVVKIFL